ncbi:aromatase/cyclase [Plantactinospora sp. B6F1]|uniref:aromatase/cyclase n=1 Tax=Plantactinospora sp. B6F1 TaxID=3158971 RepID=UPI0032D90510
MSLPGSTETEHEITVHAPAATVYHLIAEVANWPQIFPPTIHVEHVERTGSEELIRIWATANGTAKSWVSRRRLDADRLCVDFRQEVSAPPVAAMGGSWLVEPISAGESLVRLRHHFRAVGDDPDHLAWIDRAVDRNSGSELAALKAAAEAGAEAGDGERSLTFDDTVRIDGSVKDVYDFINDAQLWSRRLPHVARVSVQEDTPGLQLLEMDTRTADGSVHSTTSVRVCLPHTRIVYKQIAPPRLMTLHTGHWQFEDRGDAVEVTSRHTVVLNEGAIEGVLGPAATVRDARSYVRQALGTNSLATLRHAKEYAESRR